MPDASSKLTPTAGDQHPESLRANGVNARGRLARLTLWTFLSLLVTTTVVIYWGRQFIFERIEKTYIEMQAKTSADQASRIARLLEQELAAEVPPATVRLHLQETLSRSPYDAAGFLCLLDRDAKILCHPDARSIGRTVPFGSSAPAPTSQPPAGAEWLTDQDGSGATHLVVRHPVAGVDWQVSIHSNYGAIRERVDALNAQLRQATLPILIGLLVFGTLSVRLVGRAYESKIESANSSLELKVAERTSELAAASAYYRQIIEAAPSAIFLCDTDGKIRRANSQAAQLVNLGIDELVGRKIDDFWTWQENSARPNQAAATLGLRAREARCRTSEGREVHLHVFTRLLQLDRGSEMMFVVQDVTELKTLEREFQQAQKMETVGQLAGGIAHDFNNLLSVIMGFTDLARLHSTEAKVKERLDQTLAACERAGRISQQLLAFSRKQVLEPQVATLPALVDETRKVLARVLGEGIEIETNHAPAPWEVRVDPTQFEQAVLNLAINARDAMEGQGRLTLRSRNIPAGTESGDHNRCLLEDCVCLEAEDTGPGIPPEIKNRIFEPFFTTKAAGRGTGLGLASVQGIVQQHGGHIELDSVVGQGTRFSIFFPRFTGPKGSTRVRTRSPLPANGRGQTLLIVDDEPTLLESLCALLEATGFRCTGCATRADALVQLNSGARFDAILSDVVMPGQPFPEFLREARALAPTARMVLMTGYASGPTIEAATAAGVPVLRKPFTLDQLASALNQPTET